MNSKTSSLARTIALSAIILGFVFLIWDTIKGCTCHCGWVFAFLGLATFCLFFLWVRDMISSDDKENQRKYDEISGSAGYKADSTHEKNESTAVKVDATAIKKSHDDAGTSNKKELSGDEKNAKLDILRNLIGAANGQDDLKKILGIGPVFEQKLHEMGIKTFEQLANLSPEAIEVVEELTNFPGRVEREDWIGQAKKLMS